MEEWPENNAHCLWVQYLGDSALKGSYQQLAGRNCHHNGDRGNGKHTS